MNKNKKTQPKIVFFGTPERAVIALDGLFSEGIKPALIVTQPDRPQGRKMMITPPPAKIWAEKHDIPVIQPENLSDEFVKKMRNEGYDFFVVVAYGKILKQEILDIPKYGCINLHASLLPKLRGSSPVETAILTDERKTGVSVILMDSQIDHGPIILQEQVDIKDWPIAADDLAEIIIKKGSKLLVRALNGIVDGSIKPINQDHSQATFTKKIAKEDGLMDISAPGYKNILKFNAYKGWPGSFFFTEKDGKKIRVIITDAAFENGLFKIKKVIPEGKKEVTWEEFNRTI